MYESKETRSTVDMTTLSDGELVRGIVADKTDARLVDEFWRRITAVLAKAAKFASSKAEYGLTEPAALSEAYDAAWNVLHLYDAGKGASLKTFLGIKIRYHFKDLRCQDAIRARRTVSYDEMGMEIRIC